MKQQVSKTVERESTTPSLFPIWLQCSGLLYINCIGDTPDLINLSMMEPGINSPLVTYCDIIYIHRLRVGEGTEHKRLNKDLVW